MKWRDRPYLFEVNTPTALSKDQLVNTVWQHRSDDVIKLSQVYQTKIVKDNLEVTVPHLFCHYSKGKIYYSNTTIRISTYGSIFVLLQHIHPHSQCFGGYRELIDKAFPYSLLATVRLIIKSRSFYNGPSRVNAIYYVKRDVPQYHFSLGTTLDSVCERLLEV